ncbi:MAG: hypothetical protein VX529_14950 [Pseudomonadota bacterium]|nr:hypothetical protein [Pseudomonadota bacterium]
MTLKRTERIGMFQAVARDSEPFTKLCDTALAIFADLAVGFGLIPSARGVLLL